MDHLRSDLTAKDVAECSAFEVLGERGRSGLFAELK